MDDFLTLEPGFTYYYVDAAAWGATRAQMAEQGDRHRLQYVPRGQGVMSTAGKAGAWLGKRGQRITRLAVVAHGKPGEFTLGIKINAGNAAPLGGWLSSFFDPEAIGIELVSCEAAADSSERIGDKWFGQMNDPRGYGVSHAGYQLCATMAAAAGQMVTGALYRLPVLTLSLQGPCRFVRPNGESGLVNR